MDTAGKYKHIQMWVKEGNAIHGNTRLVCSVVITHHSCKTSFLNMSSCSLDWGYGAVFRTRRLLFLCFAKHRKSIRERSHLTKQGKSGKPQKNPRKYTSLQTNRLNNTIVLMFYFLLKQKVDLHGKNQWIQCAEIYAVWALASKLMRKKKQCNAVFSPRSFCPRLFDSCELSTNSTARLLSKTQRKKTNYRCCCHMQHWYQT